MGSIYVICSRQCPNGDGIYTLLNALYKYSTSITNQPTNLGMSVCIKYTAHKKFMNGFACRGFDPYGAIISTARCQEILVCKSSK